MKDSGSGLIVRLRLRLRLSTVAVNAAASQGHVDVIHILFEHGADVADEAVMRP
jgi:hypothetical protein